MRLLSVDIIRTLAIVMMVLVHFVENLAIGYGLEAPQSVAPPPVVAASEPGCPSVYAPVWSQLPSLGCRAENTRRP